jgi:hypothetical protein
MYKPTGRDRPRGHTRAVKVVEIQNLQRLKITHLFCNFLKADEGPLKYSFERKQTKRRTMFKPTGQPQHSSVCQMLQLLGSFPFCPYLIANVYFGLEYSLVPHFEAAPQLMYSQVRHF